MRELSSNNSLFVGQLYEDKLRASHADTICLEYSPYNTVPEGVSVCMRGPEKIIP